MKSRRKRAMTIVEVMAVIAIFGMLVTIVTYSASQVQRQSRDAKRKSDLAMIALGLQARYDSKICPDRGYYPDSSPSAVGGWIDAIHLNDALVNDSTCGQSLGMIPSDPRSPANNTGYVYSLSSKEGGITLSRKHYRLAAKLEKPLTGQEELQLDTMVATWKNSFGGATLPVSSVTGERLYNYLIGN